MLDLADETSDQSQWLRQIAARFPKLAGKLASHPPLYIFPKGWRTQVEEACRLIANHDDGQGTTISEIKEKFGGLRIRLCDAPVAIRELIWEVELGALTICADCGATCAPSPAKAPICQSCLTNGAL